MSAWAPPFPLDLGRIRPRDEAYWDEYGAAPKAFVSEGDRKKSFGAAATAASPPFDSVPGRVRSRPRPPRNSSAPILAAVQPQRLGMSFIPVRERSLEAADGRDRFRRALHRLQPVPDRRRGVADGTPVSSRGRAAGGGDGASARSLACRCGACAAGFSAKVWRSPPSVGLLGTAGAVAYAGMMMAGLRTLWRDAVGTAHLSLTVTPATLAIGYAASLIVAAAVVAWTVRSLGRLAPRALLAGETSRPSTFAAEKVRYCSPPGPPSPRAPCPQPGRWSPRRRPASSSSPAGRCSSPPGWPGLRAG